MDLSLSQKNGHPLVSIIEINSSPVIYRRDEKSTNAMNKVFVEEFFVNLKYKKSERVVNSVTKNTVNKIMALFR